MNYADADNHVKHLKDAEGIEVLGPNGAVLPAVRDVLAICAKQKLGVNTGHLSPAEALAITAAARDMGVDRIIVTHCAFEVVNISNAHLEWMRAWRQVRVQETATAIQAVGAEHFVLATDLGQAGNPSHPDGLQTFVLELIKAGITKDQVKTMGREVPGALLTS